ncbi:MAG: bifunctional 5,10-methylenetetrahydrofolate dehydrogenase/5,10-methenyltetrahydrofolate cyclohydrolase [Candidatus Komeilibacteria bacterium]|nr:bifunctional 5,10-methylenetetrahydrofolate dehydrogenase/5,10-methenyltetrahydrofolate cyclohydrolase [Candidatus Komeilibacteria bacterium]
MTEGKAKIIDGRALAENIKQETAAQIAKLDINPGLAVILVGNDAASELYVALKAKAAKQVGIIFSLYRFEAEASAKEILDTINWLNKDPEIDAILVQLPLPDHLNTEQIISAIDPAKDVDGFHLGQSYIIPGLVSGIVQLLTSTGANLEGKLAAIIARSREFTGTMEYILGEFGVSANILNPDDVDVLQQLPEADIIIVAAGKPQWIKSNNIKPGAIIIDVGTNRLNDNTVVGDVDFKDCAPVASWITPVPGGVGPMTVAMLLKNTVALSINSHSSPQPSPQRGEGTFFC